MPQCISGSTAVDDEEGDVASTSRARRKTRRAAEIDTTTEASKSAEEIDDDGSVMAHMTKLEQDLENRVVEIHKRISTLQSVIDDHDAKIIEGTDACKYLSGKLTWLMREVACIGGKVDAHTELLVAESDNSEKSDDEDDAEDDDDDKEDAEEKDDVETKDDVIKKFAKEGGGDDEDKDDDEEKTEDKEKEEAKKLMLSWMRPERRRSGSRR